jgi:hypothetical protein
MDAATGSVNQVVLEPPATPDEAGPTITARISSAQPMRHGWYRSPVHVAFRCTPGSAPLTTPCPDPVTRSKSAAEQTVTGSIEDSRGRRASVTVTLDIDRRAPVIEVGFDGGKLACQASDALSGVAWCRLRHHSGTRRGVTTTWWTAVAADVAGNTTTKHGRFAVS